MNKTMIEKVAAALKLLPIRDCMAPGGELDDLRLREAARSAILAMREPTEGMVLRACGNAAKEQVRPLLLRRHDVVSVFQSMIDAALSEET